jgi:protein-tyrosine-phosphatase
VRRGRRIVAGVVAAALGSVVAFALRAEPIPEVRTPAPVMFVCRNGVAMSVWAAAYFNRLAAARGLRARATARAAVPSFTDVPLRMAVALAVDGFRLDGYQPRVISAADVRHAELVVAIDTALPADALPGDPQTEQWAGFPPMREQYFPSRRAIKARVEALIERLARAERVGG